METHCTEYHSELIGPLTIASDGEAIASCWFGNDRYFGYGVDMKVKLLEHEGVDMAELYRPKRGTAL